MVVDPAADEIAEIAIATAQSVTRDHGCGTEGRAAFVFDQGQREGSSKMIEALAILRERAPSLVVDGELQADAALVPSIGRVESAGIDGGRAAPIR